MCFGPGSAPPCELEEQADFRKRLQRRHDVYWIEGDSEQGGPFCTVCWDSTYLCPMCKDYVGEIATGLTVERPERRLIDWEGEVR